MLGWLWGEPLQSDILYTNMAQVRIAGKSKKQLVGSIVSGSTTQTEVAREYKISPVLIIYILQG